ncbi:MAG: hypothetical protein LBB86_06960 [Oscillospiraceae bacterium]|jgi:hypothetical protein|nr:hypothetical protein [Oscillospiraceae bacterium]
MPLKPVQGVNVPPVKQGSYLGICTRIVDLGEQRFQDQGLYKPRVSLMYELCGLSIDRGNGDEPRTVSFECNLVTYKKGDKVSEYRKMLETWLERELSDDEALKYPLSTFLGAPAELLIAKEGDRNRITAFSRPDDGQVIPAPRMELVLFELPDPDAPDKAARLAEVAESMKKLPVWQQERIKKSNTWARLNANTGRIAMPGSPPQAVDASSSTPTMPTVASAKASEPAASVPF